MPAIVAAGLVLGSAWGSGEASAVAQSSGHWHFRVLLDGRAIGEHDFLVTGERGVEQVRSSARFSVRALFINLYGYQHDDTERWDAGCLVHMDAHTSDDGRETRVAGERTAAGFEVHGPQGSSTLPGCVSSFAYWDRARLAAGRLLNAQTGDYETAVLTEEQPQSIVSQRLQVLAAHYRLAARNFTVDLWYGPDGRWLALESRTPQGRMLRYELP